MSSPPAPGMPAIPEPAADCWLHPDVEVGDSPVAGRGLFARAPIPAGTPVSRLGGRLVSRAELRRMIADPATPYVDSVSVAPGVDLVLPPRRDNGYGNHGCDPNLWWSGPYELVARRDVAAGAELTTDYGTGTDEPGFTMACRCGSALCPGVVTGQDWLRPELVARYGEHWVPVLRERIRVRSTRPAP